MRGNEGIGSTRATAAQPRPEWNFKPEMLSRYRVIGSGPADRTMRASSCEHRESLPPLTRLRRLEHFRTPKWLRLLRPPPKGRHYSGIGGTGPAAILGGG